jgi:hypothetical protein
MSKRTNPSDNKFHVGNGGDGKHYWLTPPSKRSATMDKLVPVPESVLWDAIAALERAETHITVKQKSNAAMALRLAAAPAPEPAAELLAQKERDRQYHMDAINRLASFLGFHGTSFEVVQAAIDNITRLAKPEPAEQYEGKPEFVDVVWKDGLVGRNQAARTLNWNNVVTWFPVIVEPTSSAVPLLTEAEIDSAAAFLMFKKAYTPQDVFAQAKLAIRLQAVVDAEPVAWMIELEDSQYPVDSLDDPQAIDDLTNSGATAVPLVYATKGKS